MVEALASLFILNKLFYQLRFAQSEGQIQSGAFHGVIKEACMVAKQISDDVITEDEMRYLWNRSFCSMIYLKLIH